MKLFFSPGACSRAVHIALRESGVPFEMERVDLRAHTTAGGADYYQINPKGYVPCLQLDDGRTLTEVAALLQYIADQVPEKGLAPAFGTFERYQLMSALNFVATEVHKAYSPLFARPSDEVKAAATARINGRLDLISKDLGDKPYLLGDFTVVDAYLFVVLSWSGYVGIDLSKWPNVAAYVARVASRPAVVAALAAES